VTPRPEILEMSPYVPGEQPSAGARVVKLNTNEAAFPPSDATLAAVRSVAVEQLRLYPNPTSADLREAVAVRHRLTPDHVLIGNGSDDVLTILIRTFIPPGGKLVAPWPTYSLYPTLCQIQGARFESVDWLDGWRLPTGALVAADADAVFLANPNAPSGTSVDLEQLADLAGRIDGLLLVDEAYADYADVDAVGLLEDFDNVVVSRSFSKGFALAGIRLGYVLGRPEVIEQLDKVRDSYNVDAVAQAAGVAALGDLGYYRARWQEVVAERRRLGEGLRRLGFEVTDSQANFVFARRPDAGKATAFLKQRGILVRHWDKPGLRDALRVTVGTPAENTAVLETLTDLAGT
jgi:histidinol-phosphate aminotransferase